VLTQTEIAEIGMAALSIVNPFDIFIICHNWIGQTDFIYG